ncbi:flagellar export chaperone FliS [Thermodesulforhabdus norvegica]|uniref:Flagellar secretion chaperone FliS n=1 Tax=Thermodesulforhabdus norvegica TaxID=39841 RepID=A0A1I4QTV9_9BACT|nr:flagellar export chaperone FliS [Thermodesulforhabdus norvegica]SFM43143.1 flagellar protein FliS [Thermodesulforhabdus norvegica]
MPNPLDAYRKTQVETADPVSLVIMCYDAIIDDLKEAQKYHQEKNLEATYDKVRHAQDVITELLVGLDYERGGDIAVNLGRLYNFMLRQLIGVNSRTSPDYYDPLIKIMEELRDAWRQIPRSGLSSTS